MSYFESICSEILLICRQMQLCMELTLTLVMCTCQTHLFGGGLCIGAPPQSTQVDHDKECPFSSILLTEEP